MHLATWDSLQKTAPFTTPELEIAEIPPLTHLVLPLMPFQVQMLTSLRIVNNPKYKHLFQGIGRFKYNPVQIKIACNAVPVQKPPRRVPLALKDQFK